MYSIFRNLFTDVLVGCTMYIKRKEEANANAIVVSGHCYQNYQNRAASIQLTDIEIVRRGIGLGLCMG